ncbi:MAG: hypothetical protein Q4C10_15585 [Clostridia bacterium]|nr:hypothetical protein [Clostridia bacterium]
MRTVVCKFGGSSTADAKCFREIRRILDRSPARRCVVLSAPGVDRSGGEKVTAMLIRLWRCRGESSEFAQLAEEIGRRFQRIAEGLGLPDPAPRVMESLSRAAKISEAHLVSRGEWLCASLFSQYSGIPMVDAARLIAFDGAGVLDADTTLERFSKIASLYDRFVVPGFYGADGFGRVHTFPRNGSDITGALAAAGIGASLYENWTDVPGLMTADPAIVPEARLIPQVSYRQMRRLARAGAKVLHPACLDPVAAEGIPTRLRSFTSPDSFGTLIDDRSVETVPCIAGEARAVLPHAISCGVAGQEFDGQAPGAVPGKTCPESAVSTGMVSRIDVFGVPESHAHRAAEALRPLCVTRDAERFSIYVPVDRYAGSMRALHRTLIE